ncbi:cryptochrome/photolyase family protein [Methylophaga sp. OBS4]|uniref:cryptochrome/photolyase family protein n=1 Tax=Methylophaga sp. OBS4 TaxID=2991935 RepID=UPI00225A416E|nr:FAD-binding domain-containing protein [Methylophaga sp. OBS4]MCX4188546.1 deoxyribodipyrimidine photo-lyase [Methylophaga sp. OBS4]
MSATQLVWLRNDLRLDDNPALYQAQQQGKIHVVFCATPKQWQRHHESAARLGLKAAALNDLAKRLAELGIPFTLLECPLFKDVPEALARFCRQHTISDIWFNQETPLDERRRDQLVCQQLAAANIHCHALPYDLLVASPILNQQQKPFQIFTPYYRRWLQLLQQTSADPYPIVEKQGPALLHHPISCIWAGQFREDIWPAGEKQVLNKLHAFCEKQLKAYPTQRDIPAAPATSILSPYLANGQIGPRRLLAYLQYHCLQQGLHWQDNDWLRELAWRDFYRQLMLHFPRLSMGKAFKPVTEQIPWCDDEAGFQAWCEGRTGFPIVDAAMRQLLQTGWMHNRLRMIAASFLSKLLLIDWRRGEQFFMQHLVDGEFAANNGGWQWSASTGCDAAPYFRVFNPTTQSEKFDPDGTFIRRFVPELSAVDKKQIHNPAADLRHSLAYPLPVVDYKSARQQAIAVFADLKP